MTTENERKRLPLRCRLFGHRWENVRVWSTPDDAAWFCRRCPARVIGYYDHCPPGAGHTCDECNRVIPPGPTTPEESS